MGNIIGLDHVLIAAPPNSEDTARKFYSDILGLIEIEKPESLKSRGGVWFELGNQQLHIGIDKNFVPAKKAHPAIRVERLNELIDVMTKNDIQIKVDSLIDNVERFFCTDPFGNRLEFLQK